jgi:hypothetical protein
VLRQKDDVRQTLGYLPQEFGVYPSVSAENLLDHFALLKGIAGRRVRKAAVEGLLRRKARISRRSASANLFGSSEPTRKRCPSSNWTSTPSSLDTFHSQPVGVSRMPQP